MKSNTAILIILISIIVQVSQAESLDAWLKAQTDTQDLNILAWRANGRDAKGKRIIISSTPQPPIDDPRSAWGKQKRQNARYVAGEAGIAKSEFPNSPTVYAKIKTWIAGLALADRQAAQLRLPVFWVFYDEMQTGDFLDESDKYWKKPQPPIIVHAPDPSVVNDWGVVDARRIERTIQETQGMRRVDE